MIVVPKVTYGAEALIKRRDVRHKVGTLETKRLHSKCGITGML